MASAAGNPFQSAGGVSNGWRWSSVLARSLHLLAVVAFGALLLGATNVPLQEYVGLLVLASGVLLWAIDLRLHPAHLVEGVGVSMLFKLALLVGMLVVPSLREPLFWIVVAWSAVFSHAPGSFRNARLIRTSPSKG
ncbi:hypothetical protein [Propionivibrio soli]|uniref:hypothetical protein n=1 Tax=Propionivibrio soli TaxID=2976531 RepID=UPI0021E8CE2A|nr:hypothetical protein [Propionivibrio soli]